MVSGHWAYLLSTGHPYQALLGIGDYQAQPHNGQWAAPGSAHSWTLDQTSKEPPLWTLCYSFYIHALSLSLARSTKPSSLLFMDKPCTHPPTDTRLSSSLHNPTRGMLCHSSTQRKVKGPQALGNFFFNSRRSNCWLGGGVGNGHPGPFSYSPGSTCWQWSQNCQRVRGNLLCYAETGSYPMPPCCLTWHDKCFLLFPSAMLATAPDPTPSIWKGEWSRRRSVEEKIEKG